MTDYAIPESSIIYVWLRPKLWESVRGGLGREMKFGTHPEHGEFMQELHVRYVKERPLPRA